EAAGARLGPSDRANLGFLFRIVRPATVGFWRMAALLRPHRPELLSSRISWGGRAEATACPASVRIRQDGLLLGPLPPRPTAAAADRGGIPLRRLGRQLNPFPLVQLPYHRLVNPWTLGAVLHEVSHNLQSDLGLNRAIPVAIGRRLLDENCPPSVVQTYVRWN